MTASTTLPISAAGARRRRPSSLQRAILAWYDALGRPLPFRRTTNPWAVLVSEVMAQQTQIGRVGPAWESFMARFPTPRALAEATTTDVLRAWMGLGYNRRAIALKRAAALIVESHDGRVPDERGALEALPGVGPYTARAVLAIAFGHRVGPVDVNVRRVLTRLTSATAEPISAGTLQSIADDLVPVDRPADWTHALMDLGATLCRPVVPRCGECPARPECRFGRVATGRRIATRPAVQPATQPPVRARIPFEQTSRWLRGRIIRRLTQEPDGAWVAFDEPLGPHDPGAVGVALRALTDDGLVEIGGDGRMARLPSSDGAAG